ncbi:phage tail protein [Salmonella enterica subsp. enterica serovar Soerenga]|nr:phage tail protein [Salmonella enterica]EBC8297909.1 phage tail protein [Salmonella enterica subsp. enterica serovar Soerenga]EKQ4638065.1 phage tail protein [Salmonella enterica subsp. enterica serovar Bietri]EAP5922223.1 phage tail protein [Salmonella enterica]EBD6724001.1 phage tail protein [Salmonella enterica subsp. enterica serovar Soerenga]
MTAKYFAILTNQGAARLANAAALGTKLNLTQMAVGDANGTLPTPDPSQTKLINQKRIAPLNLLTVDPANTSQIIAEQIIPENEGGFWIREIGLYDDDGILIAVANCPETYKPQLQEGSGRTQTIRMILVVSSTSAITLKIDPAVVLATRQYVDDKIIEVKGYADDLMKKHVEAANPHKQYPLIANALKEMVDAGLAGDVLKNLGLGAGAPAIGIPFFWPSAAMPNTVMDEWSDMVFLKFNGATFSAATYPKLALVFPALVLPEARGEFLRIWDDGRGIDTGRVLLSSQSSGAPNIIGSIEGRTSMTSGRIFQESTASNGAFQTTMESGEYATGTTTAATPEDRRSVLKFDASLSTAPGAEVYGTGATEVRPRNIAFNFLVRAK